MLEVLRFESAANAVRKAYYKTAAATTGILASSAAMIYGGLKMDNYYWRMAEGNRELMALWQEVIPPAIAVGGVAIGFLTVIGAPFAFWHIYSNSRSVTTLDKTQRKIDKTRTGAFELPGTVEYDAITSVQVHQGRLEERANTGSVSINTLRLVGKGYWNDVQQNIVLIPYQDKPFEVRNKILEGLPTHEDLVARLRGN